MKDRLHILKSFMLAAFSCAVLSSCADVGFEERTRQENLKIDRISFSEDYSTARIMASLSSSFDGVIAIDSAGTNVKVTEYLDDRLSHYINRFGMNVDRVRNITAEHFDSLGLKMLVLADLTLPQESINAERRAVEQIRSAFCHDNLYISFLKSGGVITPTELVSDFVLDNKFIEDSGDGDKHLYRGILNKVQELESERGPLAYAGNKALMVMSDGNVWGEFEPLDSDHFASQRKMDEYASSSKWNICFFYCNFSHDGHDDMLYGSANKTILALCSKTGGVYQEKFNWYDCHASLEKRFGLDSHDYLFYLYNPDGRQYEGVSRRVLIDVYNDADSLALSGSAAYSLGNEFFPIIINGVSNDVVTIRGAFLLIAILIAVFIIFQFVAPRIRYMRFKKKYIVTYSGPAMCVDGQSVADTCYLCKSPFQEGDRIVARCEHTMHKECWDENGYRCPEYGSRCKHGSHYYNHSNLLDLNNAKYYAIWLYCAIIAAVVGWVLFYSFTGDMVSSLVKSYIEKTFRIQPGSQEFIDKLTFYNSYISYLPSFAFSLGVPLALMLSLLVESRREWWKRAIGVVTRAFAVALLAYGLFFLNAIFSMTVDVYLVQETFELLFWILFTFGSAYCLTYRSYASKLSRKSYMLLGAAVIVAFGWPYLLEALQRDYRSLIVLVYLSYTALFAIAIASSAPRSNRYVLHVEGCIKTTDIALYKWFRANPDAVVSIGRSVDCNLQLSWDIKSDVAPKQAEVYMRDGNCYLLALEDGVLVGKKNSDLKPGDSVRLYQGSVFRIGSTSFTYRETDV